MSLEDQELLCERLLGPTPIDSGLTGREIALLAYADLVTRAPATVVREDISRLHDAGFDDRSIHDACAIVGYFAFVNRIADGLGVELERS